MSDALIHPLADMQSKQIGIGTRIWQFVVVLPGARIGVNCNICSHCFIENDVIIGDNVTIKNGVQLWDGLRIGDDVFIGQNVSFTNDPFPRSKRPPKEFLSTVVEKCASIGAGATILPNIVIGRNSMVGAGAVVTRSVPPNAIVTGNPARIMGYVNTETLGRSEIKREEPRIGVTATGVVGVSLHRLPRFADIRGSVTVGEFEKSVPFPVKRYFLVFDVPSIETRGQHAHRECHQFMICVRGSCSVVADDGSNRQEFTLDRPDIGLHLAPMVWGIQYKYSPDALLLVFASHHYSPEDYIRDYGDFMQIVSAGTSGA